MSLLYQGSPFVKGNKFIDRKGAILTFYKNTKKGKIFVTEQGVKVGLTESLVKKLSWLDNGKKFIEKREPSPIILGIHIKYYALDNDEIFISKNCLKSFNCYSTDNGVIGYICFDIRGVEFGNIKLGIIESYELKGTLKVVMENSNIKHYNIKWFHCLEKINDNIYLFLFEGTEISV